MTPSLEKKFIDTYIPYFDKNQIHLLFELLKDPSIVLALSKNKLPTKKTVFGLMTAKGIDIKKIDDEDYIREDNLKTDLPKPEKHSTGGANNNIVTLLLRIESKLKDVESMLTKNIDFAMPSSEVQTDLTLSPEQRRAFILKRENYNKLISKYHEFYKQYVEKKDEYVDELEFLRNLFRQTLYMIDLIINDSFISKYKASSNSHELNSQIIIVVFDRDDAYGTDGDILTQNRTIKKVMEHQQRSTMYKLKKDSIIFLSYEMPYTEVSGPKKLLNIAFYIDYKLLISQFKPEKTDYVPYADTLQALSNSDLEVWTMPKFSTYFLSEVQDAYTHLMSALLYMDPFIDHGKLFFDVYNRYFG